MYDLIVITAVIIILLNAVWCSLISNVEVIEIKICKQAGVIFGGIMFCLAAFRDGIGFDFYNYKCIFEYVQYSELSVIELFKELKIEPSFILLNKLLPDFSFVIFFYAVVGVLLKIFIIQKYSPYILLSMLIYFMTDFINFDMGVIRQGAAISLFWVMLYFLWTKRIELAVLTICAAIFVHSSSVIYLLFLFIYDVKLNTKSVATISVISVLIFIFFGDLINYLFNLIGFDFFQERYNFYLMYEPRDLYLSFVKRLLLLSIFAFVIARKGFFSFKTEVIYNAYVFGIVIFSVMSAVPTFAGRGSAAFYSVSIFLIAETYASIKNKLIKTVFVFVVLTLSYVSMENLIDSGQNTGQLYIPYKTIFE